MSVIVAVRSEEGVIMACDSGAWRGESVYAATRQAGKLFRTGECLIGHAGYTRTCHALRYRLEAPPVPEEAVTPAALHRYVAVDLSDAVRQIAQDLGTIGKDDDGHEDHGSTLLVALRGELFVIGPDFGVDLFEEDYLAIGGGCDMALGALAATHGLLSPQRQVERAMEVVIQHGNYARGPVHIEWAPRRAMEKAA